jgi:hypothetical protein
MSIFRSYLSKNNTLISNSYVNTGRNPVTELSFGASDYLIPNYGFTRFIFNLDLSGLLDNISQKIISTGCTDNMMHHFQMTNTSSFDEELLNTKMTTGRRRATSFDLILFRIPRTYGEFGDPQYWDEGVGYDYNEFNSSAGNPQGGASSLLLTDDRSYSARPSNWYQTTTIKNWSEPGIYNNKNTGNVNFSDLIIVDRQHFEFGNEDINFNMTDEINGIINGTITDVTGWGIAYVPEVENVTGLTESYSVGFFTEHTQTFYQPFLQTTYDDLIEDDRNTFTKNVENKLYLYSYENGDLVNLDENPIVSVSDRTGGTIISDLTACTKTKGVYEITIPNIFYNSKSPCEYYDTWSNLILDGHNLPDVTNQFTLKGLSSKVQIGTLTKTPEVFGFDFYGIKQDEKILNTDIRKVGVVIKKAYSTQTLLSNVEAFYRIYVREGTTEVQVQDWTKINRTPNEYYFIFDTRDKIPNQYYVDIKVNISGQKDTYKKQLTFQIVNKK